MQYLLFFCGVSYPENCSVIAYKSEYKPIFRSVSGVKVLKTSVKDNVKLKLYVQENCNFLHFNG